MAESDTEAYARGVAAGEIAQRLKEHDRNFITLDTTMQNVITKLAALTLQLQRMADAMEADRATVITTATALEKQREGTAREVEKTRVASRDQQDESMARDIKRWTPLQRLSLILGILVAVATLVTVLLSSTGNL